MGEVWLSACSGAQQPAPWGWTDSCIGSPQPPCLRGPPRSIPSLLPDGEEQQKSPGPQTFTLCPCSGLRESRMTWRVHSLPPSENHPQYPLPPRESRGIWECMQQQLSFLWDWAGN